MSFARNFALGQQIAQTAMDAFDRARLGKIMSETKDAKVQELAPVEDVEAVPVEQIQNQQQPKADLSAPFASPDAPAIPDQVVIEPKRTQVSPKQYQLLGKTYDQPLTDDQMKAARTDSLKGRISELFNPVRGLKQMRELELQDQEDFKFGLFKTDAKRKQEEQAREDAADKAEREAFANTAIGSASSEFAKGFEEYNKAKAARDKAIQEGAAPESLPPMPAMPVMREISVADSLKDSINLQLARAQAGGKMNQEKLSLLVQAYQKANDEGYTRALTAANDGAPIDRVAELFNKAGKMRFDPANVVGDDQVEDQYGAKQRVISVYDPETKKTTKINVGAELAALGQAGASLDRLYKLSQINANNATIGLRKAQTDAQVANLDAIKALAGQRAAAAKVSEARADGTLPGGTGRGKAPKADFDKVVDYFDKFSPKDQPTQRAEGLNIARQAMALNPGAAPEEIAYAAQAAVTEGDASPNIARKLDFNTGQVVAVFTDPRTGSKVKLHQAKPTPEMAPALKAEVQSYLAEQEKLGRESGSEISWADVLKKAAANPQDKNLLEQVVANTIGTAYQTAQPKIMQLYQQQAERLRTMGQPVPPPPTREQILEKLRSEHRSPQGMAAINNRLNLIRTYGLK